MFHNPEETVTKLTEIIRNGQQISLVFQKLAQDDEKLFLDWIESVTILSMEKGSSDFYSRVSLLIRGIEFNLNAEDSKSLAVKSRLQEKIKNVFSIIDRGMSLIVKDVPENMRGEPEIKNKLDTYLVEERIKFLQGKEESS